MLENVWYACEFSHTVTNQPTQIKLWDQKIVLYRDTSGNVVALNDVCPHRGAALSLGKVHGDCIQCPYHGWQFQTDGKCTQIPANPPHGTIPRRASVSGYPVQEKYGFVWIFWGDLPPEDCPPLPTIPNFPDSSWQPSYLELTINAHYSRLVENLTDPVHTPFIHTDSFGGGISQDTQMFTQGQLSVEDWSGNYFLTIKQAAPQKGLYWRYIQSKQQQETKITLAFYLPNLALQTLDFKFGFCQYFCLVPVNEGTTLVKLIHFRNFLTHPLLDSLFRKINLKILKEDLPVVESQFPRKVPDDLGEELHVAGDALSVAYRKLRQKHMKTRHLSVPTNQFISH